MQGCGLQAGVRCPASELASHMDKLITKPFRTTGGVMITHVTTCGRYGMSVLLARVITDCCTLHLLLINYVRDNPHKLSRSRWLVRSTEVLSFLLSVLVTCHTFRIWRFRVKLPSSRQYWDSADRRAPPESSSIVSGKCYPYQISPISVSAATQCECFHACRTPTEKSFRSLQ
jgi:hypothetical protein